MKNKGFTIIELVIGIAIVAMLVIIYLRSSQEADPKTSGLKTDQRMASTTITLPHS